MPLSAPAPAGRRSTRSPPPPPQSAFLTSLYQRRRRQESPHRPRPRLHLSEPVPQQLSRCDSPPSSTAAEPGSPLGSPSDVRTSPSLPKLQMSDLTVSPAMTSKRRLDESSNDQGKLVSNVQSTREEQSTEVPARDDDGSDRERVESLVLALRTSNVNLEQCQDELRRCHLSFEKHQMRSVAQIHDLQVSRYRIEREGVEQCRALQLENNRLKKEVEALRNDIRSPSETSMSSIVEDSPLQPLDALRRTFRSASLEDDPTTANVHALIAACSRRDDIRRAIREGPFRNLLDRLLNCCDSDTITLKAVEAQASLCLKRWDDNVKAKWVASKSTISQLRTRVVAVRESWNLARMDIVYSQQSFKDVILRGIDAVKKLGSGQPRAIARLRQAVLDEQARTEAAEALLRKEANWRRLLHSQLMEMKGNIRVVCRIRPAISDGRAELPSLLLTDSQSPGLLTLQNPKTGVQSVHEYDLVLSPNASAEAVFEPARGLVVSVLDGFNVCIFAYGQTGSGKTFTMEGSASSVGVNHLALKTLFELMDERAHSHEYNVSFSVIELYNKQVFDLLADPTASEPLSLTRRDGGSVEVNGAMEIDVRSWRSMQQGLRRGLRGRQPGAAAECDRRSRSHCVVCVRITGLHRTSGRRYTAKLHLVDLAGSESMASSGVRTQESAYARQSLSALASCLYAVNTKRGQVPYRDDNLTYLLSDSFGGDCKTLVYVCLRPGHEQLLHTLNSLKFGGRVRQIRQSPRPHINEEVDFAGSTRSLPIRRSENPSKV